MSNKNQPAFPVSYVSTPMGDIYNSFGDGLGGVTKREYFAAMAMQGWLASYGGLQTVPDVKMVAAKAVELADALLAELEK
jgi:hypothetical protein